MYLNTLICLEENVAGYGKNNSKASGHITLMSPGIVKCYVQNLRQLPKEYTVYLISKSRDKAVRLGNIKPECMNKQTTWKVDLDNLQGTGVKGKDIDCAAVVVEGNSIGNTDTVLIGYTQGKYLITSMLESALPKKQSQDSKPCSCGCQETPNEKAKGAFIPAMPGEGPGPVIMPTPDINQPAKPGEGPGPVIMPTPDINQPAKPGEGPGPVIMPTPDAHQPAKPGEGPKPVIMPTPDAHQPAKPGEGPKPVIMPTPDAHQPAKPGEGPCPVIMPTPDAHQPAKPGEGPCPVIMPTPDANKPATPGEGPCPVIMPTPDANKPAKPDEGPCKVFIPMPEDDACKKGEGPCKVFIPTPDGEDAVQVEILRNLQQMFERSANKEDLAVKIENIIKASVSPISIPQQRQPQKIKNNQMVERETNYSSEEQQYLSQIETALKSIQESIGIESKEKKTLDEAQLAYKRDIVRVRDIFNDSDAIDPFEQKDKEIDWVRISMAELISMPQFSYEWCTNPVITYCYHKFGFLILGKDKHIEQYYVGVPDIYDTKRKFILSIDKVEAFRSRSDNKLMPGDYGYWIVRI